MKTHDWQPVETAPPDQLIRIMEKETKWVGTGIRKVYIDADDHVESYCQVLHYNGDVLVNRFYATHWMPTTPATSEAQTCPKCGHRFSYARMLEGYAGPCDFLMLDSDNYTERANGPKCQCHCVFPDTTPTSGAVEYDTETDAAFDEFLRTDPSAQAAMKLQWAKRMENAMATSGAVAAQPVSDPTVTVSASGVDPSLPTHCDHGVSLDDPCYMCRTATPSVSAAIAEVERLRDKWDRQMGDATGNDYSELAWRVETADEIVRALRALPPDARAVDGDLGVTPEVAEKLLRIREALAHDDIHEAWHWLYKIADSQVESLTPWAKLEACAAAITATKKETK